MSPPRDPASIVRGLVEVGEELPDDLRREILDLGTEAVMHLAAIVDDDQLGYPEGPGGGWGPIHAVSILGELGADAAGALDSMLRLLAASNPAERVHNSIVEALCDIGPGILEPLLRAHAARGQAETQASLAHALAGLGAQDERVYALLLRHLAARPGEFAGDLAEYGDPRAIEPLGRALDLYRLQRSGGLLSNHDVIELVDAIEELGGTLTEAQKLKHQLVVAESHEFLGQIADQWMRSQPVRRIERPGRNEPCWCGSGVKYKKCHLAADELPTSG